MADNNTMTITVEFRGDKSSNTKELTFNTARDVKDIPDAEMRLLIRHVQLRFGYFCAMTAMQDVDHAKDFISEIDDLITVADSTSDVIDRLNDCESRIEENVLACFYVSGCESDAPLRRDLEAAQESSEISFMAILDDIRDSGD